MDVAAIAGDEPGIAGGIEQRLVDAVERGEVLDLAGDEAVDEAAMRSWGPARTVPARLIRNILRGQLVACPDPHGLRLRGARIAGRLDLDNLAGAVWLELSDCLLGEGVSAQDASLPGLVLTRCVLHHSSAPALNAERLTTTVFGLFRTTAIAHSLGGAVRLFGAHLGDLDSDGASMRNDSGPALMADRLHVDRSVFLRNGFTASGAGQLGAVRLNSAHLGSLECDGASLRNDSGPALAADNLHVDMSVFLRHGFTASGADELGVVRLLGAHLGTLECNGASLHNDTGPALIADSLRVDRNVFLRNGSTATGAGQLGVVRLNSAHFGTLDCSSASVHNDTGPALLANSLQVDQDVFLHAGFAAVGAGDDVIDLGGVRVGGVLVFDPGRLEHRTNSHHRLRVDGLVYTGLPLGIAPQAWLDLLREGTPDYAPSPTNN